MKQLPGPRDRGTGSLPLVMLVTGADDRRDKWIGATVIPFVAIPPLFFQALLMSLKLAVSRRSHVSIHSDLRLFISSTGCSGEVNGQPFPISATFFPNPALHAPSVAARTIASM